EIDEAKLKSALSTNYDGVAALFVMNDQGGAAGAPGVAGRLAEVIQRLRDPVNGVIKSRMRGLDQQIAGQDRQIEAGEQRLESRREGLKQQWSRTQARLGQLASQEQFLQQRFGGTEQQ